ncbi:MAG TPA: DUF3300 domain-containing protein [Terriglobales bacterium]|jgi:hypothetical protein|nr:DUF3300 domain-containing protein [Terriglobales bacterium]
MKNFRNAASIFSLRLEKQSLFLLAALLIAISSLNPAFAQDSQAQLPSAPTPQAASPENPAPDSGARDGAAPPYTQQTPDQLDQLVAPIALYPDSLVAQVLAASTFPEQVVEADRWVQANPDLKGDALGQAVDQQPWDPSVKALAAFPSVLGNMDKNLSWTSSLGDAYYNQQADVMDAVQVMRKRAQAAGDLKTTSQQNVTSEGSTITVAPANPEIVYVPAYDPWLVYGDPILAWPGWYPYPGIWFDGPYLSFGTGFGIGWYGGFGWGWNNWGFDWHNRYAVYGRGRYYSRSNTFYNRANFGRGRDGRGGFDNRGHGGDRIGGGNRGGFGNHPSPSARPFDGNRQAARGYAAPRGQSGVRSGAFSGYDHGGQTRGFSSRGSASMGGGRAGGGRAGGGHGGGRH